MSNTAIFITILSVSAAVGLGSLGALIGGLVKRRPGMWITGAVALFLAMVSGGVCVGWGVSQLFTKMFQEVAHATQSGTKVTAEDFKTLFPQWFAVDQPRDVVLLNGKFFVVFPPGKGPDTYYLEIEAGPDFEKAVKSRLNESTWEAEEERLQPPQQRQAALSFWDANSMEGARIYHGPGAISSYPYVLTVAYDANAGTAYLVVTGK